MMEMTSTYYCLRLRKRLKISFYMVNTLEKHVFVENLGKIRRHGSKVINAYS